MSFDVHELDTFLLVGSAVTLLAVLAVRVSSRAGLPSLLIYLLMGVALGESGVGIGFEDAEAHTVTTILKAKHDVEREFDVFLATARRPG